MTNAKGYLAAGRVQHFDHKGRLPINQIIRQTFKSIACTKRVTDNTKAEI